MAGSLPLRCYYPGTRIADTYRGSAIPFSFQPFDSDEGTGGSGGNDLQDSEAKAFVSIVNTEASRDTVSERFGASDEIIFIKLFTAESDDFNEDTYATFALWLISLTSLQCLYLNVLAEGMFQSSQRLSFDAAINCFSSKSLGDNFLVFR